METTYEEFINNILNTRGRSGCGDSYCETHHILPQCLGGITEVSNLIDLYAHEHFIAHKLLVKANPDNSQLVNAYAMMAFVKNSKQQRVELTPEEYEQARSAFSNSMKERWKDTKYKALQSAIIRERWQNPEYRKIQSENRTRLNYEMWENPQFKKEMANKVKDRWSKMTNEEIEKQRENMRNTSNNLWKDNEYIKRHCTPVFCIETQEYFLCQQDAIKKYGFSASGLSSHLSGKQKSAGKHPKTGKPLHWKKVTWEECCDNVSNVFQSEKINLLGSSET